MRAIATIICLLVLTGCLFADHKARGRSAWAWASACQSQPAAPAAKSEVTKQPAIEIEKPVATGETITAGSCSSGTCGASSSRLSIFSRSRRGR